MLGEEQIGLLKKGTIVINTSRGALIDAEALLEGIKRQKIGGACLDVYEEEAGVFFEDGSGKILEDEDSYYSGDAMAVYLINIIESGNEITEDDAERFEELIYDGYLLTEEKIYDDFKEYLKRFE